MAKKTKEPRVRVHPTVVSNPDIKGARQWLVEWVALRTAASLVAENRQKDDFLYLYKFSYYPFLYYRDRFGLVQMPMSRGGQLEVQGYRDFYTKMNGKRLWVIFDDAPEQQERATIVLDEMGNRVYQANPNGVYVACYALR